MAPIHYACRRGHAHIVDYLLQQSASIEAKNATGQTPLMAASQMGHMQVVDVLFRHGANANAEGDHGMRPLHRAAMAGHEEIVRRLLREKADPLAVDHFVLEGAVHHAAREGHEDVLRSIMGAVHCDQGEEEEDQEENAPAGDIGRTSSKGDTRYVRLDQGNSRGETAMHLAAEHGRLGCVKLLMLIGTTEEWRARFMNKREGRCEDTALHRACEAGQDDICRYLLDMKASPNATNRVGRTPLHLAATAGHATVHPDTRHPKHGTRNTNIEK